MIAQLGETVLDDLRALLGERLSTDADELERHGDDQSAHEPAPPPAVAFPASTDEVVEIVKICARSGTPIVPYGQGSSLEGHVLATEGGVCVDLGRMDRILAVQPDDFDATVQAGVTRKQLNDQLGDSNLFFSVDPGWDASLGGMASTRASGTNTVAYGTMRENVLGLTVVLADGRVIRTGGRARKSSAGYDLTRLFVGAEGTLGILTEVTVRLFPKPEATSSAVCGFPSVRDAVTTAIRTIQAGVPVARVELLDELALHAVNRYADLDYPEVPTLFFEFHGSPAGVAEHAQRVEKIAAGNGGTGFEWTAGEEESRRLWQARHDFYFAARALRPGASGISTDVCVPISRLADCIVETQEDVAGVSMPVPLVGHVGDGNFHLGIMVDADNPDDLREADELNRRLVERALAMGGTCTGEHGIGVGKREFLVAEHGEAVKVMRSLKATLDPHNLMNPGKIFLD